MNCICNGLPYPAGHKKSPQDWGLSGCSGGGKTSEEKPGAGPEWREINLYQYP